MRTRQAPLVPHPTMGLKVCVTPAALKPLPWSLHVHLEPGEGDQREAGCWLTQVFPRSSSQTGQGTPWSNVQKFEEKHEVYSLSTYKFLSKELIYCFNKSSWEFQPT